jgi:hypothetical protein
VATLIATRRGVLVVQEFIAGWSSIAGPVFMSCELLVCYLLPLICFSENRSCHYDMGTYLIYLAYVLLLGVWFPY